MQKTPRLKEFPAQADVDSYYADTIVYQIHRTLDDFAANILPDTDYTFDDLTYFIISLVKRQNGPGKFITWGGNWSLIPIDEGAPSDVRGDLVFFPSYIAVSLLCLFWHNYREKAETIPGFLKALHEGIHFITARGLFGHGLDGDFERVEAVRILLKGKVHSYLVENQARNKACQALYDILVQFKNDLLCDRRSSFEANEILRELDDFPNMTFFENQYFSWSLDRRNRSFILEAPYAASQGGEIATGSIAKDVAVRTGCAFVVSKMSRSTVRYTGNMDHKNKEAIISYNSILREIINPGNDGAENSQFLHIILRGMKDIYDSDVELSSRYGQTCDRQVLENLISHLQWGLQGYSRRIYTITADTLFGGGSKYLDFFRGGHPYDPELPGFGPGYNALEIRISRTVRTTALGRIKDLIAEIIELKEGWFA
jgi:hypothetical protein